MKKSRGEIIQQWFEKADNDILTAKKSLDVPPIVLDAACFHCQQAVEKYLKAYLIYLGKDVIKTHSLEFLIDLCSENDRDFEGININDLEDFAVDIRYPDDALVPSLEQAKEYFQIAETVKKLVRSKIDFSKL